MMRIDGWPTPNAYSSTATEDPELDGAPSCGTLQFSEVLELIQFGSPQKSIRILGTATLWVIKPEFESVEGKPISFEVIGEKFYWKTYIWSNLVGIKQFSPMRRRFQRIHFASTKRELKELLEVLLEDCHTG